MWEKTHGMWAWLALPNSSQNWVMCTYISLIYPSVNEHLGRSNLWAIVNGKPINKDVQVFLCYVALDSLEKHAAIEIHMPTNRG